MLKKKKKKSKMLMRLWEKVCWACSTQQNQSKFIIEYASDSSSLQYYRLRDMPSIKLQRGEGKGRDGVKGGI